MSHIMHNVQFGLTGPSVQSGFITITFLMSAHARLMWNVLFLCTEWSRNLYSK